MVASPRQSGATPRLSEPVPAAHLPHSQYLLSTIYISTHCSRSLSCASLTSAAAGRSYLAGYAQVRVTMWPDLSNTNKMTNKMTVTVTSFSRFLIKYILTYGLDWYQYGSTRYACSTPELRHLNHEIYIDCVKPNKQCSLCIMRKIICIYRGNK